MSLVLLMHKYRILAVSTMANYRNHPSSWVLTRYSLDIGRAASGAKGIGVQSLSLSMRMGQSNVEERPAALVDDGPDSAGDLT